MIQPQRRDPGFLVVAAAVTQVVEKQMKVSSIAIPQMSVRLLVHPVAQSFLILNVLHCSHFLHSPTDLLQVGHWDAHLVEIVVVARMESDYCP